jgi:hypothetical protein
MSTYSKGWVSGFRGIRFGRLGPANGAIARLTTLGACLWMAAAMGPELA